MSKNNGVKKFSRHQDVIERRMRVISRLEQQLKDDFKNTKTGAMQLLPKDVERINKELETLKQRI